jgi:hypothetical protein
LRGVYALQQQHHCKFEECIFHILLTIPAAFFFYTVERWHATVPKIWQALIVDMQQNDEQQPVLAVAQQYWHQRSLKLSYPTDI